MPLRTTGSTGAARSRATAGRAVVDDDPARMAHTGLRIAELGDGEHHALAAGRRRAHRRAAGRHRSPSRYTGGDDEAVQLRRARLRLRRARPMCSTSPIGHRAAIAGSGRVAVAEAPATRRVPAHVHRRRTTCRSSCAAPGASSRQVHNFGTPAAPRRRPPHRLRGHHPGRELVVATRRTSTTRPSPGASRGSRRSTTSRPRVASWRSTRPPRRTRSACFRTYSSPAGEIDTARRGAHRRHRARAATATTARRSRRPATTSTTST